MNKQLDEREHLLSFRLRSGDIVDMERKGGDVILSNEHHEVTIPHATGKQALDLIAFLEPMGEVMESAGEN